MQSRDILLIEPGYPNKYPPLGLMKLAAYHGSFRADSLMSYSSDKYYNCSPHPFDIMAIHALYQTVP